MTDNRKSPDKRTTIRDLSSALNLSVSTISRAFTRPDLLNPETVERVRRLATELGYQANLPARDLKTRSTGLVFVIVPNLHPFFLEVLRGIESGAAETGHTILMGHTNRDPHREASYFDQVASGRADGVILVSSVRRGSLAGDAKRLPPTVVALEAVSAPVLPTVRIDHAKAAEQATTFLINAGHRKLVHVAGTQASPMAVHRREGFLNALEQAGIPSESALCIQGQSTVLSGQRAMTQALESGYRPTAVFAANDEMAIGAVRAAKSFGLRIPDDLSVIGFNDQGLAAIYDPPLSTVQVPTFAMGRRAMLMLNDLLRGRAIEDLDVVFPTKLIERATTASLRPIEAVTAT